MQDEFGLPKARRTPRTIFIFKLQGFESDRIWPAALIVERICPANEHSHWQAVQSLSEWMRQHNVPGLYGIDVRQLVKQIRERGTMKAKLIFESDNEEDMEFVDINKDNLVAAVSRKVGKTSLEMQNPSPLFRTRKSVARETSGKCWLSTVG